MAFSMHEKEALERGFSIEKDGTVIGPSGMSPIGKIIKGYRYVRMHRNRKKVLFVAVHRLQAYVKFGNKLYEPGIEVRHLNGNAFDNRYDNIAIGTHSQNMMDCPIEVRRRIVRISSEFRRRRMARIVA